MITPRTTAYFHMLDMCKKLNPKQYSADAHLPGSACWFRDPKEREKQGHVPMVIIEVLDGPNLKLQQYTDQPGGTVVVLDMIRSRNDLLFYDSRYAGCVGTDLPPVKKESPMKPINLQAYAEAISFQRELTRTRMPAVGDGCWHTDAQMRLQQAGIPMVITEIWETGEHVVVTRFYEDAGIVKRMKLTLPMRAVTFDDCPDALTEDGEYVKHVEMGALYVLREYYKLANDIPAEIRVVQCVSPTYTEEQVPQVVVVGITAGGVGVEYSVPQYALAAHCV